MPGGSNAEQDRTAPGDANASRDRQIGRRTLNSARNNENDRRFREAVQTLRENLPQLLEQLGESVDSAERENENVRLAFIELKRQLGERYAASLIEELERGPRDDVDPGYLGIQVASHIQLIDTMTVAKQHASPELQGLLQQGIDAAWLRLQRARQLMVATAQDRRESPPRP